MGRKTCEDIEFKAISALLKNSRRVLSYPFQEEEKTQWRMTVSDVDQWGQFNEIHYPKYVKFNAFQVFEMGRMKFRTLYIGYVESDLGKRFVCCLQWVIQLDYYCTELCCCWFLLCTLSLTLMSAGRLSTHCCRTLVT